jgi:hypothetical protein
VLRVLIAVIQTAVTVSIIKKGTYFSRVIKLFVHKVEITSLGYVTSGVENNQKQTYRKGMFDEFYTGR